MPRTRRHRHKLLPVRMLPRRLSVDRLTRQQIVRRLNGPELVPALALAPSQHHVLRRHLAPSVGLPSHAATGRLYDPAAASERPYSMTETPVIFSPRSSRQPMTCPVASSSSSVNPALWHATSTRSTYRPPFLNPPSGGSHSTAPPYKRTRSAVGSLPPTSPLKLICD